MLCFSGFGFLFCIFLNQDGFQSIKLAISFVTRDAQAL